MVALTRWLLGLLVCLGACGPGTSAPPASPQPTTEPDPPAAEADPPAAEPPRVEAPAEAETEEGEWVWQPNEFRSRINAGRSGPVVGYLKSPEILADAERRGSSLFIQTPFERENDLPLYVSIWADRTEPFEAPDVQDPIRVASHHRVLLHVDEEAPVELSCDTIEVLEDGEGRTWARVARRGVVLEGWIEGRIEGRGPVSCPPRIVRGGALPSDYVESSPNPPRLRRGSVWWLVGTDERACQEWTWRGRRLVRRTEGGVASYGIQRSGRALTLTGPGFEGDDGTSMGMGCALELQLVGGDADRWVFVPDGGADVTGYHPDDTEIWYRSAEACEAAEEAEAPARGGC